MIKNPSIWIEKPLHTAGLLNQESTLAGISRDPLIKNQSNKQYIDLPGVPQHSHFKYAATSMTRSNTSAPPMPLVLPIPVVVAPVVSIPVVVAPPVIPVAVIVAIPVAVVVAIPVAVVVAVAAISVSVSVPVVPVALVSLASHRRTPVGARSHSVGENLGGVNSWTFKRGV